jgi:hypothetical protein
MIVDISHGGVSVERFLQIVELDDEVVRKMIVT